MKKKNKLQKKYLFIDNNEKMKKYQLVGQFLHDSISSVRLFGLQYPEETLIKNPLEQSA